MNTLRHDVLPKLIDPLLPDEGLAVEARRVNGGTVYDLYTAFVGAGHWSSEEGMDDDQKAASQRAFIKHYFFNHSEFKHLESKSKQDQAHAEITQDDQTLMGGDANGSTSASLNPLLRSQIPIGDGTNSSLLEAPFSVVRVFKKHWLWFGSGILIILVTTIIMIKTQVDFAPQPGHRKNQEISSHERPNRNDLGSLDTDSLEVSDRDTTEVTTSIEDDALEKDEPVSNISEPEGLAKQKTIQPSVTAMTDSAVSTDPVLDTLPEAIVDVSNPEPFADTHNLSESEDAATEMASDDRINIILHQFHNATDIDYSFEHIIAEKLRNVLRPYRSEVRFIYDSTIVTPLLSESEKQAIWDRYHADIAVWGWYNRRASALVDVNIEIPMFEESFFPPSLDLVSFNVFSDSSDFEVRPSEEIETFQIQIDAAQDAAYFNMYIMGLVHQRAGRNRDAIERYTAAISHLDSTELRKNQLLGYYLRGNAYFLERDCNNAIKDYQVILDHDETNPAAWNNLGNFHACTFDTEAAYTSYTRAIELRPDYTTALLNRAFVLSKVGEWEESESDLNRAVELSPESPVTRTARLSFYILKGDIDAALTDWYSIQWDHPQALSELMDIFSRNDLGMNMFADATFVTDSSLTGNSLLDAMLIIGEADDSIQTSISEFMQGGSRNDAFSTEEDALSDSLRQKYSIAKMNLMLATEEVLVQHTRVTNNQSFSKSFSLNISSRLLIQALGEISSSARYDYGWIENVSTGDTVWTMTFENTEYAGGEDRNRQFNGVINLPAGDYEAYFVMTP